MAPIFAYYCSGHGLGHATRVSAVASYLCQLGARVYVISSAPKHIFTEAVSQGTIYRYADIDPVIVQPVAYHVDRKKSVDVLNSFLLQVDPKIDIEVAWLKEHSVDCVLSDAAFLACKAANAANIPSALVTNFTFDSVYSYLARKPLKGTFSTRLNSQSEYMSEVLEDESISSEDLEPLVHQLFQGYRCADLLVRLPGHIPIPSFGMHPSLPSHVWADLQLGSFHSMISDSLSRDISSEVLHAQIPFPFRQKPLRRRIIQSPLVVREPSPDAFLPEGRERILAAAGVPAHVRGPEIKILVVSFGGQFFRRPSSHTPTRIQAPTNSRASSVESLPSLATDSDVEESSASSGEDFLHVTTPIASPSRLYAPGSSPAIKTMSSCDFKIPPDEYLYGCQEKASDPSLAKACPEIWTLDICPTPDPLNNPDFEPRFLPDLTWIGIVCGASPPASDNEKLPLNFFLAPRDVYMPDLTAIADVVLGKLGYGTVAECVATCTPLVFVPRPLFIEEHGLLRLLINGDGVEIPSSIESGEHRPSSSLPSLTLSAQREQPFNGEIVCTRDVFTVPDLAGGVEMPQASYEAGNWGPYVARAFALGRGSKQRRRARGSAEDVMRRAAAIQMAQRIIDWVHEWQAAEQDYADGDAISSRLE